VGALGHHSPGDEAKKRYPQRVIRAHPAHSSTGRFRATGTGHRVGSQRSEDTRSRNAHVDKQNLYLRPIRET
jgi:hypothetical protein